MTNFRVVEVFMKPMVMEHSGQQVYPRCLLCAHRHGSFKIALPEEPAIYCILEREARCQDCGCEHERLMVPNTAMELAGRR